jgi:hypothetical protein
MGIISCRSVIGPKSTAAWAWRNTVGKLSQQPGQIAVALKLLAADSQVRCGLHPLFLQLPLIFLRLHHLSGLSSARFSCCECTGQGGSGCWVNSRSLFDQRV